MSKIYDKNIKVLKQRMPIIYQAVNSCPESDCEYIVSDAKSGEKTLAIKKEGKTYQIHSKYDPIKEAEQQLTNAKLKNPKVMMILGFGLGYTIRAANKIYGNDNYFTIIVEKDIKAFKTAMEYVDLTDLFLNNKYIWVIGIRHTEAFVVLNELLRKVGLTIQLFLKTLVVFDHPVITKIHGDYHQHILQCFKEAAFNIIFNYGNSPQDSIDGLQNIMDNMDLILKSPGINCLFDKFKKVPGILVSTGPSLDKNIEELKKAEGKCVMIAADSALKILHKHNITPHAAVSVERVQYVTDMFKELPDDYKSKIWLSACPVILKTSYEAWNGPKVIAYRNFAHFEWIKIPKGTLNTGPSCSNLGFKILEAMGCDPIILVGQDCSFASAVKTHADGASDVTNLHLKQENLYKVKGNYQDFVYTNNIYDMFRKAFETDMLTYKGTCINATEGGAYIEGTKLLTLKEAIETYCKKSVDTLKIFEKDCIFPSEYETKKQWKSLRKIMLETRDAVQKVVNSCLEGQWRILEFEERLERDNFREIDDFLERFPDDELKEFMDWLIKTKAQILTSSKYFNQYLMHIVQMVIVKYELDINQLPSLSDDKKRCNLQHIKIMKKWFKEVGGVCQISLKILVDTLAQLEAEFGIVE